LAQDPDVPRERYTPDALLRLAVTTVLRKTGASARTEAALKAVRTATATG